MCDRGENNVKRDWAIADRRKKEDVRVRGNDRTKDRGVHEDALYADSRSPALGCQAQVDDALRKEGARLPVLWSRLSTTEAVMHA